MVQLYPCYKLFDDMISHFTLSSSQPSSYHGYFIFQKQAMLVRQLEEEVVKTRAHAKETNPEIKAHIEGLQMENDHLTREVAILKETTKVMKLTSLTYQLLFQYIFKFHTWISTFYLYNFTFIRYLRSWKCE